MNLHLHPFWRNICSASRQDMRLLAGSLVWATAALIAGCGQPGAGSVAPPSTAGSPPPSRFTEEVPPESLPPDPKTLARIKETFARTPVRPLPKDADISQSFYRWQTKTNFWRRVFLDGFRSRQSGEAAQTAQAEKFLEGYCLRLGESPDAPSTGDLLKQGEQLDDGQISDPHVHLALAAVLWDSQKGGSPRLDELHKSLEDAFQGGKYSPWLTARFHRLKAMLISSQVGDEASAPRREQMELMIDDLFRAGSDPGLTNIQRQMLAHLLSNWEADFPAGEFRVAWTMKLESAKNIDPWLREILLARLYNSLAWKVRGLLFRYSTYTEHARRHALRAWELKPELPEAAREMLNITMADKGAAGEDVRFWFDEAVQADFNYPNAYFSLVWALRPRWGGSHAKMIAFGDECLATQRFDTNVPFMFHNVVSDVAEERGGWGVVVQLSGIYERYKYLFEGLAQQELDEAMRNRHRSRLAAVSYLAAKRDEARQILSELKKEATPQDFELFHLSLEEVRQDLESNP